MIRPITVICWILALGSGLYLYRAKHEVEVMDHQIELVAKQTSDIRSDSRRLLDDWIRLGQPEQLQKYSDEYLGLKAVAPTQFVRLVDLPARLPAPRAEPPADVSPESPGGTTPDGSSPVGSSPVGSSPVAAAAPADQPVAEAEPAATEDTNEQTDEASADDLPLPPIPPAEIPVAVVTSVSLPAVTLPLQARPVTPTRSAALTQEHPVPPRGLPPLQAQGASQGAGQGTAEGQAQPAPRPDRVVAERGATERGTTESRPEQGLPPLQAQKQPPGQMTPSRDRTVAEGRTYEPREESMMPAEPPRPRPVAFVRPPLVQAPPPGYPPAGYQAPGYQAPGYQAPGYQQRSYAPPAAPPYPPRSYAEPQPAPRPYAPPQNTSLLGMQRGAVPPPVPAPTPVSARWSNPDANTGR